MNQQWMPNRGEVVEVLYPPEPTGDRQVEHIIVTDVDDVSFSGVSDAEFEWDET